MFLAGVGDVSIIICHHTIRENFLFAQEANKVKEYPTYGLV